MKQFALTVGLFLLLFFSFTTLVRYNLPHMNTPDPIKSVADDSKIAETEKNDLTLLLGGDVMLGRMVAQTSEKNSGGVYPFVKISDLTKSADIFFVNLETPIINNCPKTSSSMVFCAPPMMLDGLKSAGINIVNLANNHSLNYGEDGLSQTITHLKEAGISYVGINNRTDLISPVVIKKINDLTLGFLGFDFTSNILTENVYQLIRESASQVDLLVVGVHWGDEYKAKANVNQRQWASEMVKAGADIIAGHHPHWVQNVSCFDMSGNLVEGNCDLKNNKLVYYSLGNLVFDQMWSEDTKKGMLVRLTLNKNGVVKEERFNTYIRNIGQPEIVR
ncbi:MAG: SH3 type 3 domain protein [Candidatus Woesebacteria bacterium GW2011_GWA1_39_21]|uniref:SH3 type 3 domain protein n=1 Tax=Candidatus Woesebacteria bacterium GW2011_GWA1_39_21 TaxID=1618550 RepID=A0A0G0RA75_9BACT|nr:MAG: SH3 type 3 domain protein [Candidatus Woesebacteria bacterium GW2011_GWA1_39_21]